MQKFWWEPSILWFGAVGVRNEVGNGFFLFCAKRPIARCQDQGPWGGNLTVCWVAEMESSEVASLNLGWQRRWTPSCIADSPLSTHLGTIPSGGVRLQLSQLRWQRSQAIGAGVETLSPMLRSMEKVGLIKKEGRMMSCSRHPQSVSPYQSTEKKSRCGGNG